MKPTTVPPAPSTTTQQHRLITSSLAQKLLKARTLKSQLDYKPAINLYCKCIFLHQDPQYLLELAQIYSSMLDLSTSLNLHKRAQQLKSSQNEKIRTVALLKGFGLLDVGSVRNILVDCEVEGFRERYVGFRARLLGLAEGTPEIRENLMNCLGFLETDYRLFALEELEKCLLVRPRQIQLVMLNAFIKWSITKMSEGYRLMWEAHEINPEDPMVVLFLKTINPKIEALYKETQYLLIDGKIDKCVLNIKKGLEMNPNNTQLLIVKAYIHRTKQEYQLALCDLQLANKTLKDHSLQTDLRNQIALTYNQMGTFLFNKKKFTQAIALFNQGIAFKPNDWGMRANRGDCYKSLNDYTKALQDYLAAHHLSSDNQDVNLRLGSIFNSRGIAHFNNKNPKQAVLEFTQALKYCRKYPQFFVNRGKSLVELGRYSEALADFESAVRYDPRNQEAQRFLVQYRPEESKGYKKKVIVLSDQK